MKPLVENADAVLKWSTRLFSSTLVNAIVKRTFFRHFCAGALVMHGLQSCASECSETSC